MTCLSACLAGLAGEACFSQRRAIGADVLVRDAHLLTPLECRDASSYNDHMPLVNNVTRMLDAKGVAYAAYELPEDKLGAREAAKMLNVPVDRVFKTIVVGRDAPKGPLLVLVPGDCVVDLKKVALAVGERKVHLPTEREAEHLTGLRAGGISPLALINKGFRVLIDASAETHDEVFVSGGQRGLNIRIQPRELARLTRARLARIAAPEPEQD